MVLLLDSSYALKYVHLLLGGFVWWVNRREEEGLDFDNVCMCVTQHNGDEMSLFGCDSKRRPINKKKRGVLHHAVLNVKVMVVVILKA